MNTSDVQNAEPGKAKTQKEQDTERRMASARRAYEGGEMSVTEIAGVVRASTSTVKRWIAAGKWVRGT